MKYLFFWILVLLTTIASAQQVDSIVIKQVDSLILVSRDLTAKRDFDQALEVNAAAEKLALENLGRESASYGRCAFHRGSVNHFKKNYQEAEKWYLESIAIREKIHGKEHLDYTSSLNNLAILYMDVDNYEKAEPLYLETVAIREKILGKKHPEYAGTVTNLALLYVYLGNLEKAETLYLEAKVIFEDSLKNLDHPFYLNCLNNLAYLYSDLGNYEKAETLYLQAIGIREKMLGKEHSDYVGSLVGLANLYLYTGNYDKAEPLYLEIKAVTKKVLGIEHPEYAASLINLALLYDNSGNYDKAELLFLEAKDIFENRLKILNHTNYINCLEGLANLYNKMGIYEKAEPLYFETKAKREEVLGKDHPYYGSSLNNLANLYNEIGNFELAEPLYLEALAIWEKALGVEHPHYAISLNNLAMLYMEMGNYEKAEPLFLKTKAIREKVLNKEHPDYAQSLNNLAIMYHDIGNHQKAEHLFLEAKAIRGKVLGLENPDYATTLDALASLYSDLGNYEKAEHLYLETIAIREKVLGKEHSYYSSSLYNLAGMYEKENRFLEVEPILEEALTRTQSRLLQATSFLSEKELTKYTAMFQSSAHQLNGYLLNRQTVEAPSGMLPTLAYDHALFYKGFLLTAASRLSAPSLASPETVEINLLLKGYRRRLAEEYTKPIAERKGIAELEDKANLAEKELTRSVAGYADALRQVKWEEVKAGLKQSEAAIEFVHFLVNFPLKTDSTMYAALLLLPGATQPLFIPLFEEKEFDHLLSADKERKSDYVNELYAWADRGMVKLGSEKKSLYDLIWAKIEAAGLEGIKTVYYSPSGVLHRLNLGAIALDDETILSDRYNLVAMNSTRQLVIPTVVNTPANDALLVGGVNFEVDSILTTLKEQPLVASRSAADAWTESGTRGGTWAYLRWTKKEVERIAASLTTAGFKTVQLMGSEANEEAIKAIDKQGASPRILHIAAHGFFFPDPEVKKEGLGSDGVEPVFKSSDNPMIRSGLILAGGNYAWQHGKAPRPDMEDGILTAYEISQMNLANTELVVLSACETGLGDIQGNEGVYGLQRAFKIAGAKYLIMSLWQVPDQESMEFMTAFYKNWLDGKMTIPDAFRKTQREMRDRFINPYSWAGFVLVE